MILDSLLSVFLVIALGFWIKQRFLPAEEGWKAFEQVSYLVLIPALIIKTIALADLSKVPVIPVLTALLGANLVVCAALLAVRPLLARWLGLDGPGFTSVFQGSMRWNAFIALALAGNLFGAEGIAMTSVAVASLIPLLNIEAVLVLKRWGKGGTGGSFVKSLIRNPFIIGSVIGLTLNLFQIPIPRFALLTLDILAQCALGAGLLLVGAGLRLDDIKRPSLILGLAVFTRLIILPLVGAGIGMLMGLSGVALGVVVICMGVPAAAAAYILARQMGGDAPLVAAIITAQTLVSTVTLPLIIWAFAG